MAMRSDIQDVIADARAALIDKVHASLRKATPTDQTVKRLTIDIPDLSLIDWLAAQTATSRLYWRDREGIDETAGVGSAETLLATSQADFDTLVKLVHCRTAESPEARYLGGLQFDRWSNEPSWSNFGAVRFVLPRLELRRSGDGTELVCYLIPERDSHRRESIVAEIERLVDCPAPIDDSLPALLRRIDNPDRIEWRHSILDTLESIHEGRLSKVALARQTLLTFAGRVDPLILLRRLADESPSCYLFCFQPDRQQTFLGATPEQLFARQGRELTTEAVAGTRRRGSTDEEDRALAYQLLDSDKERREQASVTKFIGDELHNLCTRTTMSGDRELLKLRRVQHLITRLSGLLRDRVTDADLLRSLHPTPAVCGESREDARLMIKQLEPFERGWYAGPVGWIGNDAARFAVGIRSARVIDATVELYAGAGIVDGSTADDEWEEIDAKLNTMLAILRT